MGTSSRRQNRGVGTQEAQEDLVLGSGLVRAWFLWTQVSGLGVFMGEWLEEGVFSADYLGSCVGHDLWGTSSGGMV